jgi:hypothetical protein
LLGLLALDLVVVLVTLKGRLVFKGIFGLLKFLLFDLLLLKARCAEVLLLHLLSELDFRVFGQDLLSGHVELLEEKISLRSGNHVFLLALDELAGLQLEEGLVLGLSLLDVVIKGLLLDAGSDHLLLLVGELLVGDVGRHAVCGFVELLGVLEGCSSVEVDVEGALHVGELALHRRVPVVLD